MVGWGRPLLREILGQPTPVRAKCNLRPPGHVSRAGPITWARNVPTYNFNTSATSMLWLRRPRFPVRYRHFAD